MPIIDLQRRIMELGRIRLGEQVATSNGKTRPAKLDKFRLTSKERSRLDAAAVLWGGEVRDWEAPDGPQFELYTETNSVPIIIPPTEMAFSQWYEQWTAGGCKVRCDGARDQVGDKACHCDPDDRACNIHTRLSVMLPDLPGLGVWRVETHGYYAAVELSGAVQVCQQFAGHGQMLPARLRLEQRRVLRTGRDGKAETRRFAVPVIDVDVLVGELAALAAGTGAAPAVGPGPLAELAAAPPSFTPVPDFGAPTLEEQMAAVDHPPEARPRANARAPLPATGVAPRPAAQAGTGPSCVECGGPLAGAGKVHGDGKGSFRHEQCPTPVAGSGPDPHPVESLPADDPDEVWERQRRRFHAVAGKRWPGDVKAREEARHAWLAHNWGVESLKDLDAARLANACDLLEAELIDETPAPVVQQVLDTTARDEEH